MNKPLRLLGASLFLLLLIAAACQHQCIAAPGDPRHPARTSEQAWRPTGTTKIPGGSMGTSTLTPENLPAGPDRRIHQGHGTAALGPSDSSDSGSDMAGNVGRDLGDSDLDSDTDSTGTGERGAVGRDKASRDGSDIDTDRIESMPGEEEEED